MTDDDIPDFSLTSDSNPDTEDGDDGASDGPGALFGNGDEPESSKANGEAPESPETNGEAPEFPETNGEYPESAKTNGDTAPGSNGDTAPDSNGDVTTVSDIEAHHTTDTDDDQVEPVELLVQLAEEGEIEPWDIDIVKVTDAFLEKLDEVDLRTTGRALFYASVLLRMKSDEMLAVDDEDPEPEAEPWELAMEGGADEPAVPGFDPVDALEEEMDRRLERKSTRGSPETLDELVRELRDAERGSWWKQSREYDTSGSPTGFNRGSQTLDYHAGDDFRREGEPTEGDVTGNTHDEDIEDVIEDVRAALRPQYDSGRKEVLFTEIADSGGRPFMTFLALQFLAHRGAVRLQQDELFGDLWIRDPAAVSGPEEAVAD